MRGLCQQWVRDAQGLSAVIGRLVLCATPIGNLGDITLRALDELRGADLILAEDTRRTSVLLRHHGITCPMVSYHEHNETDREALVLQKLESGHRIVLATDAGTPCLADPGYRLVRAAVRVGAEVTALPGPSALLPALALSALPMHSFAFHGFMPRADGARRSAIQQGLTLPMTAVWYESPRRLTDTLTVMRDLGYGDRAAAVARELTKVHEEVLRGSVTELASRFVVAPKGEIVLCVGPRSAEEVTRQDMSAAIEEVERRYTTGEALSPAVAAVATERGIARRHLYAETMARRKGHRG